MKLLKVIGILLIVAGVIGVIQGQFSYTEDTHEAKLGPVAFSIEDKETIDVPLWAGVGAIVVGGIFFVVGSKRR